MTYDPTRYPRGLRPPCIGVCSTDRGDHQCEGCGRRPSEVTNWSRLPVRAQLRILYRAGSQGYLSDRQRQWYPEIFRRNNKRRQP